MPDPPPSSVFQFLRQSWTRLFASQETLSKEYLHEVADARELELSVPDNLERCREELAADTSTDPRLSVEELWDMERKVATLTRLLNLWQIVWIQLLPLAMCIPWMVMHIPEEWDKRGPLLAGLMFVAACAACFVLMVLNLFIQLPLSFFYLKFMAWILGIPLEMQVREEASANDTAEPPST
ncbi:MAG: hypothetical protein KDA80_13030 [Planctomycetaceae bacterium]|nr:hypothetical protein [Planctomycetaceae bacterium]